MMCNIYDLYFRLDVPTGKPSIVAFRRNDNARPVLKYEGLFNVHDIEKFLDEISLPTLVRSSLFFCLQNITFFVSSFHKAVSSLNFILLLSRT